MKKVYLLTGFPANEPFRAFSSLETIKLYLEEVGVLKSFAEDKQLGGWLACVDTGYRTLGYESFRNYRGYSIKELPLE